MDFQETASMTLAERAKAMCDNPADYFGHSVTNMHLVPKADLADLQLEALRQRLAQLRQTVPMLQKLADSQGIDDLTQIDDVVPLLFEHTMYKSYPPSLLENGRFAEINRFLSKLCAYDLTTIDVSGCETIDDWIMTMDRESPLLIMHSSGTSGVMSFLPTSKAEWDKFGQCLRVSWIQTFGEDPADAYKDDIHVIFQNFRHGGAGMMRMCENLAKYIAGAEERVFAAYPGRMSADLLYLGAKIRAAQAKGNLSQLKVAPSLLARKAEYEHIQEDMAGHMVRFFLETAEKLKGKRVFFFSAQNHLWNITNACLDKGLRQLFAPNSIVNAGGDNYAKDGNVLPPGWRDTVGDVFGVTKTLASYGMTEVGGLHHRCEHNHYHFQPWVVPFLLDPDTSKPLPRKGRITGRGAFYDLGSETRWGGFISGDELTVDWDTPCPCGRTSAYIEEGSISRYSAKRGGDDKINCAATEAAHQDAMDFLTSLQ